MSEILKKDIFKLDFMLVFILLNNIFIKFVLILNSYILTNIKYNSIRTARKYERKPISLPLPQKSFMNG